VAERSDFDAGGERRAVQPGAAGGDAHHAAEAHVVLGRGQAVLLEQQCRRSVPKIVEPVVRRHGDGPQLEAALGALTEFGVVVTLDVPSPLATSLSVRPPIQTDFVAP
jgi:hypothetical protein